MRITLVILILGILQVHAEDAYSQKTRVSLNFVETKLITVLDEIEKESEFFFLYNEKLLDTDRKVSIAASDQLMSEVLDNLFAGTDVNYTIIDRKIILAPDYLTAEKSQPLKVTGTVTDASTGEPLPGVYVVIEGTNTGGITDVNGKYSIEVSDQQSVLVFSSIGYLSEKRILDGKSALDIALMPDIKQIQEVVIIGYGTMKKSDITGSVSSISTNDFAEQNVTRVDQILQGRSTGVQVTNVTGAPGSDVRIRVRGANSALGDNNPLFVIDGFVGADYNMLNPNDIESIEILKDASSTAIYGSRGSNGVILISTKTGTAGKLKMEYQGQFSLSNVIGQYDMLSAGEFAETVNAKNLAYGLGEVFTETDIDNFYKNGGVDWQDEIYRTAFGNEHQLSVSGGNELLTFMVSGNYLKNEGIIENSQFKRYIIRSNIKAKLTDKLSLKINLSGSSMNNLNTQSQRGTGNPVVQALAWAPTTPKYDENGNYTIFDPVGSLKTNPLALIYDRENLVERLMATALAGIQYKLNKSITLNSDFFYDYSDGVTKNFAGEFVTNYTPTASITSANWVTLQNTTSASFNHTFNEIHNINAVGVFEMQQSTYNNFNSSATDLTFPELKYDNLSQAASYSIGSGFSKWSLMSMIARINYSFKEKYLISASLRRDGSSKFQPENRWSIFPAVSLGWNVAQEDFMRDLKLISRLKIRASWGYTGSQAVGPYSTLSTYAATRFAYDNTGVTNGIMLGNPGNKDLKWETTEQKNIGLELGVIQNRLVLEADYFIKNTTDLLLNRPMPYYVGGGSISSNVGEIENKGWELMVTGIILNGTLNWKSSFNISHVRNTVVSLGGIADRIFTGSNTTGIAVQSEFVYEPGQPLGSYWGLKYLGTWKPDESEEAALFNKVPGDARYEDIDNNHEINNDDFQIIGNGFPKYSTGFNNTFEYKNFTLNAFFIGIFGSDKLNNIRGVSLMAARDNRQATLAEIRTRYIPGVNETSDFPGFSTTNQTMTQSSQFMESGDFIRLKNLSLGYTIPKLFPGKNVSAKVLINATNILTFTKYKGIDPEVSTAGSNTDLDQGIDFGAYPNCKTYSVGINLSF